METGTTKVSPPQMKENASTIVMLSGMRKREGRSESRGGRQRQLAAQLVDGDPLDDVHAHAAAAGGRHLCLGREARSRQEIEQRFGVAGTATPARAATAAASTPRPSSETVSSS